MSSNDPSGGGRASRAAERPARNTEVREERRPYTPPAIVFREVLEVVASTCSGITAKTDPGSCPFGPIQS